MKPKTILNGAILFIGLGLAAYSQLNGYRLRFNVESVPVEAANPLLRNKISHRG